MIKAETFKRFDFTTTTLPLPPAAVLCESCSPLPEVSAADTAGHPVLPEG